MTSLWLIALLCIQGDSTTPDVGVFPKALWYMQEYGNKSCSWPNNDVKLKSILARSLADDRELSMAELEDWISPQVFKQFSGEDDRLSTSEISAALEKAIPSSRRRLNADLRRHAEFLTTSLDTIDPSHLPAMEQLSDWIVENWKPNGTLHVISTCTGNSRRSILGASMGNLAAAYYGFDNIRFYSGGTVPSAFNKRTIATLKEIGFQIEPTGEEAERSDPKTPNALYRVKWGEQLETIEFSKSYKDPSNPQSGFAAILVCSEADAECPTVAGASIRISMTFLDPKVYDDGAFENRKYAERRDDIGRTFLAVMAHARRRLQENRP